MSKNKTLPNTGAAPEHPKEVEISLPPSPETPEPAIKQLSKAEKLSLFKAYSAAKTAHETALKAAEAALVNVSSAVREIHTQMGAGPYMWGGVKHTAIKKAGRNGGPDTYYFRAPGAEDDIEEIK